MPVPMPIPMSMAAQAPSEESLNNAGNIDAFLAITFHGPMQNPTLLNITNSDSLSVTYNMTSSNERIEIDTVNRTALHFATPTASGTNVRQYVSGDFLVLASGNNSIRLTTAAYNTTGYVNLSWRDSFSGV